MQQHSESEDSGKTKCGNTRKQHREHSVPATYAAGHGPGQCCRRNLEWSGFLQGLVS
jgi:hypothetical protein